MKKRRILFVAEELDINGAMKSLIALLMSLESSEYDLSLFLFRHGGALMKEIPSYVHVLPEKLAYVIHRMPLKSALKYALRRGRLDLMLYRVLVSFQRYFHIQRHPWAFLPAVDENYDVVCGYPDGFVAPMIMRKVTADKKICWVHYLYTDFPQDKYVYDALKRADLCVPVSVEAGKALDTAIGEEMSKKVVHNLIDISQCRKLAGQPLDISKSDKKTRIVTVGRVTYKKGVDLIPDIALIIKARGIDFEWYVIGAGDIIRQLQQQVAEYNLQDNVFFIGSRPNPMPWVKSADIVVCPSRSESWGMTVSEALCLGKAIIASNLPVFAEQLENGVNGLLCNLDADSMSNAIIEVIGNQELKETLERNASSYPFSSDTVKKEFEEIISDSTT